MSRNISTHVTPMEPFCIWSGAFTAEDCDKILQLGELAAFQKGRIGKGDVDEKIRNSDICWIEPAQDTFWIFDRMDEVLSKVNFDKFQMDLVRFDSFQYSKYNVGGHYTWHTDTTPAPANGLFRKLSLSLALTEPEEYEGGELCLNLGGEASTVKMKVKKGDLAVFYSHVTHCVEPVLKGTRVTLVTWALGGKIK